MSELCLSGIVTFKQIWGIFQSINFWDVDGVNPPRSPPRPRPRPPPLPWCSIDASGMFAEVRGHSRPSNNRRKKKKKKKAPTFECSEKINRPPNQTDRLSGSLHSSSLVFFFFTSSVCLHSSRKEKKKKKKTTLGAKKQVSLFTYSLQVWACVCVCVSVCVHVYIYCMCVCVCVLQEVQSVYLCLLCLC